MNREKLIELTAACQKAIAELAVARDAQPFNLDEYILKTEAVIAAGKALCDHGMNGAKKDTL